MSKSRGQRRRPLGDDRASSGPTPSGSTCSPRARCGCPSGSTRAPSRRSRAGSSTRCRAPTSSSPLRRRVDAGPRRPPAERPLADRWILAPARRHGGRGARRVGGLRRDRRRPSDHGLRGGRRLAAGTSGSTGPGSGRPTQRPIPAAVATLHEVLTTVARLLAPAAPFASDWIHRALTGTSVHLARFPVSRGPPGRRGSRRRWTPSGGWPRWPARRGRSGKLKVRQPLARMQVAVPAAVRGPRARRAARAASGRGQREGRSRSSRPTPTWCGSRAKPTSARSASATASARRRSPPRRPASTPGPAPGARARRVRPRSSVDGEAVTYLPGGRRGGAGGGERLAGAERRALRRGARSPAHRELGARGLRGRS